MQLYQVATDAHKKHVRTLFWEYLQWGNTNLEKEYGIKFDIETTLEEDMKTLDKFLPPKGRLILAEVEDEVAGLSCMKALTDDVVEIKRMYVRPDFRGRGVGRAMLQRLVDEAKGMGYPLMRLDSAKFMTAAHAMYRSFGFKDIDAYEGSEIPKDFQDNWIFMELSLS